MSASRPQAHRLEWRKGATVLTAVKVRFSPSSPCSRLKKALRVAPGGSDPPLTSVARDGLAMPSGRGAVLAVRSRLRRGSNKGLLYGGNRDTASVCRDPVSLTKPGDSVDRTAGLFA